MRSNSTFKLQIVGLAGILAEVKAEPSWSVDDLQRAISRKLGIVKREQRLLMEGALLLGPQKLLTLGCAEGSEITLLRRDPDESRCIEKIAAMREGDSEGVIDLLTSTGGVDLTANAEVMLCAVRKSIKAAACASEELQSDRNFILSVLREGWMDHRLGFMRTHETLGSVIPSGFRSDPQIMLAAVSRGCAAFQMASEALRSDRDFVIAVMQSKPPGTSQLVRSWSSSIMSRHCNHEFLAAVGHTLWSDLEVVLAAVRLTGLEPFEGLRPFVSQTLRNDAKAMHAIVQVHGLAIQYASEAIRANHEIATAAARQNRWALHHVSAAAAAAANHALKASASGGSAQAPADCGPNPLESED